jgi:hypothetical protein
MSKRLEILKKSLAKKEQEIQSRFDAHFATVKQANGQPLNDKRNGHATLKKWERQNDGIRAAQQSVEITKAAIEKEEYKLANIEHANESTPAQILKLVEEGQLIQWRKHPNTFFVPGVDKGRIVWDEKQKQVAYRYYSEIKDAKQRVKFARTFNALRAEINAH